MIDFFSDLFFPLYVLSCVLALGSIVLPRYLHKTRVGIIPELFVALLGFIVGSATHWGYNENIGVALGPYAMPFYGLGSASAGFLLGFGGYLAARASMNKIAIPIFLVGLIFPANLLIDEHIRPYLIEREWAWWETALAAGFPENMKAEARNHFSTPIHMKLAFLLHPSSHRELPESTLLALDDLGLLESNYEPLPESVARRKYRRNPLDPSLSINHTIPADILREMSDSQDLNFLAYHLYNPAITDESFTRIRGRLTSLIEAEKMKTKPNLDTIEDAEVCLSQITRIRTDRSKPSEVITSQ